MEVQTTWQLQALLGNDLAVTEQVPQWGAVFRKAKGGFQVSE